MPRPPVWTLTVDDQRTSDARTGLDVDQGLVVLDLYSRPAEAAARASCLRRREARELPDDTAQVSVVPAGHAGGHDDPLATGVDRWNGDTDRLDVVVGKACAHAAVLQPRSARPVGRGRG